MDEEDQQTMKSRKAQYSEQIADHNLTGDDVKEVKGYDKMDRY